MYEILRVRWRLKTILNSAKSFLNIALFLCKLKQIKNKKSKLNIGKHPLCHWRKHAFYGVASSDIYIFQNSKRRICKNIYSKYLYYHLILEVTSRRCSLKISENFPKNHRITSFQVFLKRDSDTGVFLWISKHFFCRTPPGNCLCTLRFYYPQVYNITMQNWYLSHSDQKINNSIFGRFQCIESSWLYFRLKTFCIYSIIVHHFWFTSSMQRDCYVIITNNIF